MAFNTNGASTAGPKGLFSTDPLDVRLQVKLKSDLGDIKAGSVYESIRVFCQEDKKFYTPKDFDKTAPTDNVIWIEVDNEHKDATYERVVLSVGDIDWDSQIIKDMLGSYVRNWFSNREDTLTVESGHAANYFTGALDDGNMFKKIYAGNKIIVYYKEYYKENAEGDVIDDVIKNFYFYANPTAANQLGIIANKWYKAEAEYDGDVGDVVPDIETCREADLTEVYNFYHKDYALFKEDGQANAAQLAMIAYVESTILKATSEKIITIGEKFDTKQDKLSAGSNITIEGNVISATGGGSLPDELKDAVYTKGGMRVLDFTLVPRAQEIASSINYEDDDRYAYIDTMQDSSRYRMFTSDYICTKPFVTLDSYADEDFEEPVTTYLMVSPEDAAGLGMEANTWYKVTGYDSRLAYDTWEKADYNEVYNTYKSWKSRDNWTVRYAEFMAILDKTILHSPVDTTLEGAIDTKQNVLKAGEGIVIDNDTNSISVDFPEEYKDVTYKKASVDFSNSAMHTPGSIATFSKEEEIDVDHTRETTYTFDRTNAKALTGVGSTTTNYRNVIRIIKDISIYDLTIFDYSEWDCEVYFLATEPTISTAGWEIKENTWYKCKTDADYIVDMSRAVEVSSSEVFELMNSVDWTVSSSRRTDYEYLMDVMFSMTLENKFDSVSDRIDSVEENTKRLLFYGYSAASDITTYKVLVNIDSDVAPTLTDGLTLVWTVEKEIKRDTYIQLQGSTTQKRLIVSRQEDWDLIDEQGSYASQYALYRNSCVIAAGTTVVITYSGGAWRLSDYDERQTLDTLYDARGETVAIYTETEETTPTLYPFKILAETQDGRYACLTYDQSVDHRWSQIQQIHYPLSNIKYKFGTRFLYYFRNEARPLTPYITNPVAYPELSDMDYIDHGYIPLMHTFTWAGGDHGHIFAYNNQVIRRLTNISGTIGQTPETIYLRVVDNGDGTWSLDGDERNGIQNNVSLGLPSENDGYVYIALAKIVVNNGPSDIGQIYNSYYLLKDHPTYRWCGDHWGLDGSAGGSLPDDFTNVKYTSKEAEIDWSNPVWHDGDRTIYEENPGYFMTLTTFEVVTGNEDNNGACVAIYDLDEVLDYVMFAPDAIPLNGFPDVKAGIWYKATDYDDDGLYSGLEEVGIAEPIALFNSIKARGGYIVDRDLYDYFVAEVLTEKAPVDVTFGEKFAESEVKVKSLLDATETVLESNTIYNGGKLGDIDISLPASLDVTYITQVHFSTPEEDAPSFVYDERILFNGDDCEDGVFTPIEWTRYSIMIFFDGETPIGMVMRI